MSAVRLCLDGVQTYGDSGMKLLNGLPMDRQSTYLFARRNSGDVTRLNFHLPWACYASLQCSSCVGLYDTVD
eukprot:4114127-Pleurochrysis_carterae.AAC.1